MTYHCCPSGPVPVTLSPSVDKDLSLIDTCPSMTCPSIMTLTLYSDVLFCTSPLILSLCFATFAVICLAQLAIFMTLPATGTCPYGKNSSIVTYYQALSGCSRLGGQRAGFSLEAGKYAVIRGCKLQIIIFHLWL